ncbi:MAG: type I pullulanase [Pseudoflavonifractor sp.]|nr:type I pullulanase [Alloprevotella sp.]MCM1116647.1 type I pullulanase [Pseudoflavonifractor sp.]
MKFIAIGALLSAWSAISALAAPVMPHSPEAVLDALPIYSGNDLGVTLTTTGASFRLWSPEADSAKVTIYPTDRNSVPIATIMMKPGTNGTWTAFVPGQMKGRYYTFAIKYRGQWLAETPGIWAKAAGANGERAAIIDLDDTNPEGWENDCGPATKAITDAVIYEMHHRDFSIHPSSGIAHKGKFLALTEEGTHTPSGQKTGIDHLKELGVTHVHILPSYDYNSVDETNLPANQYNWGYDPWNYNLPEGSYSTDPSNPEARIREMKQMVKTLHDNGIGVVMDVVYNHTANNDDSNFSLIAPGYFYRHNPDGSYSDASGCGNETASERQMMRDYIVNSVAYWAKNYHIDGFRFDLMAIHDIETMNAVSDTLAKINPDIFVYGEGWTAGDSPLPKDKRALKENVAKMKGIAVFSDDLRDAVKGHYSDSADRGFATGKPGLEETIKIGIVASTAHPQVDYSKGNNSKFAYASAPTQVINYVSCHDDLTLTDKLAASMAGSSEAERQRAARLAQTIVFTSQGTPFMLAGEEIFRDKKGVHNTYKSPDSINAIDWGLKAKNTPQFDYYREMIALRRAHPAFRLTSADEVATRIIFDETNEPLLVAYTLDGRGLEGETWQTIRIAFNGADTPREITLPKGEWLVIADDGQLSASGLTSISMRKQRGKVTVAPRSALILAKPNTTK